MPLDIPDQTIATKTVVPNGMTAISNILGVQQQRQALQQGQQTLQSNDMNLQAQTQSNNERKALNSYMQSGVAKNPDGSFNLDKMNEDVPKIAPQTGWELLQRMSTLSSAQTQAQQASQNLTQSQLGVIAGPMGAMGRAGVQDPKMYINELDNIAGQNKNNPSMIQLINAKKTAIGAMPPNTDFAKGAILSSQQLLSPDTQQSSLSPTASLQSNGNSLVPMVSTPSVMGSQPSIAPAQNAQPVPLRVPPTSTVINPATGVPGMVGAVSPQEAAAQVNPNQQPSGAQGLDLSKLTPLQISFLAKQNPEAFGHGTQQFQQTQNQPQVSAPRTGFLQTGLAPGAEGNMGNNVAEMSKHYSSLQDNASGNQLVQSLTGNIKSLANGAATGTESGRKAYLAGLLDSMGIHSTGDIKTDSDLLEKYMAQLNLTTPASSDASRTLISAARPHSTMNVNAINEAADQFASQVKANVAVRNYLTPYKFANNGQGDPQGYQAARQTIEKVADPRVFQYESIPANKPSTDPAFKTARQQFLGKLQPDDRANLIQKAHTLSNMGLVQ